MSLQADERVAEEESDSNDARRSIDPGCHCLALDRVDQDHAAPALCKAMEAPGC